jgi:hypothetical protein
MGLGIGDWELRKQGRQDKSLIPYSLLPTPYSPLRVASRIREK